jgi:hypothetical protein
MSIIREKVKYDGNGLNLKFNLNSSDQFLGYQQEIDNLTQFTSTELVNPPVDVEKRRFKNYAQNTTSTIRFQFTLDGTTYNSSYVNAGFTSAEVSNSSINIKNSFYIMDFYDNYDVNTQTKILTTYLTKIEQSPYYTIDTANQLYYLYVPVSYINENLDMGINSVTGYIKLSFFNARNGQIVLFYNYQNRNLSTAQKMYFTAKIDLYNKTWGFINPATGLVANQLWSSYDYVNKVNNISKYTNEQQNYPSGTAFVAETGKYI